MPEQPPLLLPTRRQRLLQLFEHQRVVCVPVQLHNARARSVERRIFGHYDCRIRCALVSETFFTHTLFLKARSLTSSGEA